MRLRICVWISLFTLATAFQALCLPDIPPTTCIISADDAGTAAAWALAVLNSSAVLTTWSFRDLGGDLASAVRTDMFTSARNAGGLSYVYDRFARRSSDTPTGQLNTARIAPPGPSFAFLSGLFQSDPALSSRITFLSGWMPLPMSGTLDSEGRTQGLVMVAENGTQCYLPCTHVIEGSNEGYALKAFNVSTRFGREGLNNNPGCDTTNCGEAMAGCRIFGACKPLREDCNASDFAMGLAPPWYNVSDTSDEVEDVSMAASALLALRQYAVGAMTSDSVASDSPWLLTGPPNGYDESNYWFLANSSSPPTEGYIGGGVHRCSMEHSYGLPRWYEVVQEGTGGVVHYLRVGGDPWPMKRAVEQRSLGYAAGALYYLQTHLAPGWGLDNTSYTAEFPACTSLRQVGTSAYGGVGYEHLSCRLYKRVNTRLASASPVGGQALLPRPLFKPAYASITRTYWEPSALRVPLYPVDYRGVLADTVPMPPFAGPEGLVSLVYGTLGGTDAHGLHRRIIEPDKSSPGPYVRNLLSPGAPRTTFQAQAAIRIHATASNLGLASAALITAKCLTGCNATDNAPTALAQWIMASRLGGVLYFSDAGLAGGPTFALAQLPGVYGVPPGQLNDAWAPGFPTRGETVLWFAMYANGLLTGSIPQWPPAPAVPSPPTLPDGIVLPFATTDTSLLARADLVLVLDAIVQGSAAAVLAQPLLDAGQPVHLRDIRAVITRHILHAKNVSATLTGLAPYAFPAYILLDSFNRASGIPPAFPEWPLINGNATNASVCSTDSGLGISSGVLVVSSNDRSIRARLCSLSSGQSMQPFQLTVEMGLEQTVVPAGQSSVTNAGLLFLYTGPNTTEHGFFGLLNDAGSTGADGPAGAGFDINQTLLWGLRAPGGPMLNASIPWPDGQMATFLLEVDYNGQGRFTGSINGVEILNAQGPSSASASTYSFGIRAGEGVGRAVYQQLVMSA